MTNKAIERFNSEVSAQSPVTGHSIEWLKLSITMFTLLSGLNISVLVDSHGDEDKQGQFINRPLWDK